MPYKHLAINYIRTLQQYFPEFKKLASDNSEIINYSENMETEKWQFEYYDREVEHGFYFKISDFTFREKDQRVFCTVDFTPSDAEKIAPTRVVVYIDTVIAHFKGWISLLKVYNELELTPQDKIRNYYDDLYYADFEILDEDAESVPFDLERQLLIEQFAVLCIEALKNHPNPDEELILDAVEIRDTVQSSTKKEIIQKVSKFFAKVARKSLPLLKELATEAKKTIFKKAIEFGFKEIQDLLTTGFHLLGP